MTQENRELLIKDLCARMPYSVKVKFRINEVIEIKEKLIYNVFGEYSYITDGKSNLTLDIIKMLSNNYLDEIKPYLFPLSSMTEEQKEEHKDLLDNQYSFDANGNIFTLQDFYCKYHLDFRGLIDKMCAIDATGLNIY